MLALRRKPSARIVVSGLVVTLCRGTTGLADGAVDARAGVRMRLCQIDCDSLGQGLAANRGSFLSLPVRHT
jgi:hypothetical protein